MTSSIAVTPGEPAGIGPDLCIQYVSQQEAKSEPLLIIADAEMMAARARLLGISISINEIDSPADIKPGVLNIKPVSMQTSCEAGILNPANSPYVLETLKCAVAGCLSGDYLGLVTGPVQKSVINDAGIPFSGHTEFLANLCGLEHVVMMLATKGLRVALATTHLPLSEVAPAITQDLLHNILGILHEDLQKKFGIAQPEIIVAGLNPHAGEGGHLGREEIDTIIPVLDECRHQGMNLIGPLPADTLFTPKILDNADAVLAMYHDQGLPVLKYKGFGNAVNITLGLPIIRTSVDHGTALDLAGSGKAETGSMHAAIISAREMAVHWSSNGQ